MWLQPDSVRPHYIFRSSQSYVDVSNYVCEKSAQRSKCTYDLGKQQYILQDGHCVAFHTVEVVNRAELSKLRLEGGEGEDARAHSQTLLLTIAFCIYLQVCSK